MRSTVLLYQVAIIGLLANYARKEREGMGGKKETLNGGKLNGKNVFVWILGKYQKMKIQQGFSLISSV